MAPAAHDVISTRNSAGNDNAGNELLYRDCRPYRASY